MHETTCWRGVSTRLLPAAVVAAVVAALLWWVDDTRAAVVTGLVTLAACAPAGSVPPMSRARPDRLTRSWWTADRVSRAGLVFMLAFVVLRIGDEDEPAAEVLSRIAFPLACALHAIAIAMYIRERRRRRGADSPADAGRGGGR